MGRKLVIYKKWGSFCYFFVLYMNLENEKKKTLDIRKPLMLGIAIVYNTQLIDSKENESNVDVTGQMLTSYI